MTTQTNLGRGKPHTTHTTKGRGVDVNGLNRELKRQAGILTCGDHELDYKREFKKLLRILDEQQAIGRYTWYNFPNLTSLEVERLLYYKGQLCFFYYEPLNKFYLMPFALDGTIDFYGRYNYIHPVPFASSMAEEDDEKYRAQKKLLANLRLKVYWEVPTEEELSEMTYDDLIHATVILRDYTPQWSQSILPRQGLQEGLLDAMSEIMPMARTALRNATGVTGLGVEDEDCQDEVSLANQSVDEAVLQGNRWIPIKKGAIQLQDLASGQVAKGQEYFMALQSMDNFRLSLYGLQNGGLFEKKAYVNETSAGMNAGQSSGIANLPLANGLIQRQDNFSDIVNALWPLGMSCEISEPAAGIDMNGDGLINGGEIDSTLMDGGDDQWSNINNVEEE